MQLDIEVKQELEQRFIFHSLLGKGSFGCVYQCEDKRDNQIYAVKIISKINVKKSKMKCLREQARLLSSIDHPNIVKVYQFVETDIFIYLRMQYIRNGTLQKFIKNRWETGKKFTDSQMSMIMRSLFLSLNYIHSINIIHRDIKPENILMSSLEDFTQLKMADFGLSTKLDFFYPKTATSKCGTMLFMAPQILNNLSYSKSVDIWSCSIIMYQLAKGQHPFYQSKMTTEQYKSKIKNIIFEPLSDKLANDFLQRISKVQPNQRYTSQQALKHPWLTRNFDQQIPQSLHQSFIGFQKSHSISNMFKLLLTTKFIIKNKYNNNSHSNSSKRIEDRNQQINIKKQIPENYMIKKDMESQQSYDLGSRKYSKTSWKKLRNLANNSDTVDTNSSPSNNNNNNSKKQKNGENDNNQARGRRVSKKQQPESPAILKLNKIFDSLLDRKNRKKQGRFYTDNLCSNQPQQNIHVPNKDLNNTINQNNIHINNSFTNQHHKKITQQLKNESPITNNKTITTTTNNNNTNNIIINKQQPKQNRSIITTSLKNSSIYDNKTTVDNIGLKKQIISNKAVLNSRSYKNNHNNYLKTINSPTLFSRRAEYQSPPKCIPYKEKLENQIQRLVREYKVEYQLENLKSQDNMTRRILPQNKKQSRKYYVDKYTGQKTNQSRGSTSSQSTSFGAEKQSTSTSNSSTHKIRYRKKAGSALRLYE